MKEAGTPHYATSRSSFSLVKDVTPVNALNQAIALAEDDFFAVTDPDVQHSSSKRTRKASIDLKKTNSDNQRQVDFNFRSHSAVNLSVDDSVHAPVDDIDAEDCEPDSTPAIKRSRVIRSRGLSNRCFVARILLDLIHFVFQKKRPCERGCNLPRIRGQND
jgi:hypothetical protein